MTLFYFFNFLFVFYTSIAIFFHCMSDLADISDCIWLIVVFLYCNDFIVVLLQWMK